MPGSVCGVFASPKHTFSKEKRSQITLVRDLGVEGDAHSGRLVQHLFDQRRDPTRPNLRQVHLLQSELLEELRSKGFDVQPGELGENIATRGVDLLALPRGTRLQIGATAVVEITGLRSCCVQIENFHPGLLRHILVKQDRTLVRKGGVMAVIRESGIVSINDSVAVTRPTGPFEALEVV